MNTKILKHLIYTSTGSYHYFCSEDINQAVVGKCSDISSSLLKNIQPPAHSWWQHEVDGDMIAIGYSEKSLENGRPTEHYHCILINIENFCDSDLQPRQIAPLLMSHRKTLDNIITDDVVPDIGPNDEVIKSSDEELELLVPKIELSPEGGAKISIEAPRDIQNIGQRGLDWLICRGVLGKENGQLDITSREEVFDLISVLPVHLRAGFSFCCGSILPEGRLPFNITFKISEKADELRIPEASKEYRLSQEIVAISNTADLSKLHSSFERYWGKYKFIYPELSLAEINKQVVETYPDEQRIQESYDYAISTCIQKNELRRAIEIVNTWEQNGNLNVDLTDQWKRSIFAEVLKYVNNLTYRASGSIFDKARDLLSRIEGWKVVPGAQYINQELDVLYAVSKGKNIEFLNARYTGDEVLKLMEDMLKASRLKESDVQKVLRGAEWGEYMKSYPYIETVLKKAATAESLNEYSKFDIADSLRKKTVAEFVSQYGESQDFWQTTRSKKIGELLRLIDSNPQNEFEHLEQEDSSSLLVKVPELILLGAEKDVCESFTSNAAAYMQTLVRITAPKSRKHYNKWKRRLIHKKDHDPDKASAIDETHDLIDRHLGNHLNRLHEMFVGQPQFNTEWDKYLKEKKH